MISCATLLTSSGGICPGLSTFPCPKLAIPKNPKKWKPFWSGRGSELWSGFRLSSEELAAVTVPDTESGERWSARKVLRRLIYYELYHIRQLKKLLTP